MTELFTRRNLAIAGAGVAAASIAACTPQDVTDVEKKVADVINQVQAGVVAGCSAFGKIVPTANSVIAVVASLVGGSNPALVTTAVILQAIEEITGMACKAVNPPDQPKAVLKVNVRGVDVEFY